MSNERRKKTLPESGVNSANFGSKPRFNQEEEMFASVTGQNERRKQHAMHAPAFSQPADNNLGAEFDRALLVEALSDLYHLLEEYAPAWYTEEHHNKAEIALRPLKGL